MLEDAHDVARERFHATLLDIDTQRKGPEWHDDNGWHNLGELGRAVLAWQEERIWVRDRWTRIKRQRARRGFERVIDMAPPAPRRSREIWAKLLSMRLDAVRAARDTCADAGTAELLVAHANQRLAEIARWDSDSLNGRVEDGMYVGAANQFPCPFLDCLVVDVYVNGTDGMRDDVVRPLQTFDALRSLLRGTGGDGRPKRAGVPSGNAESAVRAFLAANPSASIRTVVDETGLKKHQVEKTDAWKRKAEAARAAAKGRSTARKPMPLLGEVPARETLDELIAEQAADAAAEERATRRRPR